jgi:signal transduction histidine kinase
MASRGILRSSVGWVPARLATLDLALALGLIAVAEVEAWLGPTTRPRWLHALIAFAVVASLVWRRRFPLPVLALVLAGLFLLDPGGTLSLFAAVVIAAYTTGAELDPPRAWLGLALAVIPFWFAFAIADSTPSDFVAPAVLYGGAWGLGRVVRERGRRADELATRVSALERELDEKAKAAILEERARIARELHDVVSHSISVIAIQGQAVRRRLGPGHERESEDLRALETTARQAMAELRRLFGVLRADGERVSLAPQPGLDQLEALVEEARATGLRVELQVRGGRVPLPPGVDLAAYRIVQEALTNTRQHADPTRAAVEVRFGECDLELLIEDDGRDGQAVGNGGGHGLVGMRERTALYGGTLEAGPGASGGFRVRASLPFREGEPA